MKSIAQLEESLQLQAEEALKIIDSTDILTWQRHPCTTFLLKRIEAEILRYHINWENGTFTEESQSGTIQKNAQALGALDALSTVSSDIEELATALLELNGENEEDV